MFVPELDLALAYRDRAIERHETGERGPHIEATILAYGRQVCAALDIQRSLANPIQDEENVALYIDNEPTLW